MSSNNRGGRRPGAGRPKGSLSKRTKDRLAFGEEAAALGITPLEIMLRHMRSLWDAGRKADACTIAKDVAPYVHPRLSAVEQNVTAQAFFALPMDDISEEQWLEQNTKPPSIQ